MTQAESLTIVALFGQLVLLAVQMWLMRRQLKIGQESEERARRHDRLSVRPYLDFMIDGSDRHLHITLVNQGLGVAVQTRIAVEVDRKAVMPGPGERERWPMQLLEALGVRPDQLPPGIHQRGFLALPAAAVKPGGVLEIADLHFVPGTDVPGFRRRIRSTATYESLYEERFTAEVE